MNSALIALIAFASIFGATLVGMRLRHALPEHDLSAETKDSVRVGMGLVVTMTALLLGLLIASAKSSYDNQRTEVIQIAAKIGFLDRILAIYGPETVSAREVLRREVESILSRIWSRQSGEGPLNPATAQAHALYDLLEKLAPQNDAQRLLKTEALDTASDLSKTIWLLSAQNQPSIVTPLLVGVVIWLTVIFLSFGVFAPKNKTAVGAMLIVALSVSSSLFLMLELDRPFDGMIQISSEPLRNMLSLLGR